MTTWRRLGVTLAAATVLVVVLAAPGAAQRRTTTTAPPQLRSPIDEPIGSGTVVNSWAVAPAGQSTDPTQPSERPFFTYSAVPGQVIDDAVVLYNYSNVPLTFRLYPTDAFNNADGGFDALSGDKKPKDVGSWITVEQEAIALPAKSQVRVPVKVRVPSQATPGDHAGAVLASSVAQGTGPDGRVVNVDRRTGTRVYIRVAGPLTPELAITRVHHVYRPSLNPFSGRSDVTYRIENQGNVRLSGRHRLAVAGILGLGSKQQGYKEVPELLPGQSITLTASFKGIPATFVDFATVKVDADDAEGKVLRVVSRRSATVAMPWSLIALGIVLALVFRARRAYRVHATELGTEPHLGARAA